MYQGHRVVDSDGHLLEPADVFDGVDPRYLEQAPRILRDERGRQGFSFFGRPPFTNGPFGPGDAVTPQGLREPKGLSWDQATPGGFDPHARIRDMDADGIDAAVLFPTLGLFLSMVPQAEASAAIARALNDHAAEYARPYPDRLFCVGVVPLKDVVGAVAELQRVAAMGFVGIVVRPNPDPTTQRRIDDSAYEPLWSAAEEAGMVVAIHEGVNPFIPFAGIDRCQTMYDWHCVSHPFEQMLAMLTLGRAGVFERHPNLRVGFMESNCGWLPYWLERLDSNWRQLPWQAPEIKRPPSEYFQRQCAITCEADEEAVGAVADLVGDDRIMWASDYPHYDSEPGAAAEMFARDELSDERKTRIMATNADRFFRLHVPVR